MNDFSANQFEMACYAPTDRDGVERYCMSRFVVTGECCPKCGNKSREFLVIIEAGSDLSGETPKKLRTMYGRIHTKSQLFKPDSDQVGAMINEIAKTKAPLVYAVSESELKRIKAQRDFDEKRFAQDNPNSPFVTSNPQPVTEPVAGVPIDDEETARLEALLKPDETEYNDFDIGAYA